MEPITRRHQLVDTAAGFRLRRMLLARERWPQERLRAYQQERLEQLVRHAIAHSPFHRERLAGRPVVLERLPVLTREELVANYDDLVCDRRLRTRDLLSELEAGTEPRLCFGEYRLMATSGSSGRKAIFVYDRPGWRAILAQFLRLSAWMGVAPKLPRLRMAAVMGGEATHMSRQGSANMRAAAFHNVLALPVTAPTSELVEAINRHRPEHLVTYPSVALALAEEQLAGRLRVSLRHLLTTSELRTPEMTERLIEAFGVEPFDMYATTEGIWGADCENHNGIHLFTDMTIAENVDADGRAVPPGTPGARLLVTNLENRVQPIIRLEVSDSMTLAPEACPCGRTLPRVNVFDGRAEDVLELPGRGGCKVRILPMQFGMITRDRAVREFQVRQEGRRLRILVVAHSSADPDVEKRLAHAVAGRLAELGVDDPQVAVEQRDRLVRPAGGKLRLVVADTHA